MNADRRPVYSDGSVSDRSLTPEEVRRRRVERLRSRP
jgi:hypothetical protein